MVVDDRSAAMSALRPRRRDSVGSLSARDGSGAVATVVGAGGGVTGITGFGVSATIGGAGAGVSAIRGWGTGAIGTGAGEGVRAGVGVIRTIRGCSGSRGIGETDGFGGRSPVGAGFLGSEPSEGPTAIRGGILPSTLRSALSVRSGTAEGAKDPGIR